MVIKELYQLTKRDLKKAAGVLTKAFHNDPLVVLVYPNEEERKKYSPYLWESLLKDGIRYGEVYAPTSKIEGTAKWLPPGKEHMGIWRSIRSGALKMSSVMKRQKDERVLPMRKIAEITGEITKLHKELVKEPHWYLANIGIDPEYQGKGFGSKLIKPMLERIEIEGFPVFLETNFEGNVALYEHLGFKVIDERVVGDSDITNWAMIKRI
jgi:ribosomal protein S18 acetylase RimI-like enzyme